jgi:hypothetical protein
MAHLQNLGGFVECGLATFGPLAIAIRGDVIAPAKAADMHPRPSMAVRGQLSGSV